jgi:hypothetical protein
MSSRSRSLLVLGHPGSGKTHYAGQLYGRLHRGHGRLRFTATPKDRTVFSEVLGSLENGLAADHTPTETWKDLSCSISTEDGRELDLLWPEYGGEQLNTLLQRRVVPAPWRQRLAEADGWLLFLRLNNLRVYENVLDRPAPPAGSLPTRSTPAEWDANAQVVELIQIFLTMAGRSLAHPLTTPRLAVLLSCWDELGEMTAPPKMLRRHLPLVASFLEANWAPEALTVWGLSSLGQPLSRSEPADNYLDKGPERFGYVIAPAGGSPDPDLTRPLTWLLGAG